MRVNPFHIVVLLSAILLAGTTVTSAATPERQSRQGAMALTTEHHVRQALAEDPRLVSLPIRVNAEHGTVTLRGWVDSDDAKRAAERLALAPAGVRHVVNVLEVESSPHGRDRKLRDHLREVLLRSPDVEAHEIDVHVQHGVVHLQGTVGSVLQKRRARALAREAAGTARIVDGLNAPTTWTWSRDWQIREDLEHELAARGLPARQVHVTVARGIVTLDGLVRSLEDRALAEAVAHTLGAAAVRNRLEVREDAAFLDRSSAVEGPPVMSGR